MASLALCLAGSGTAAAEGPATLPDVNAFMTQWLATQNTGRLEAYSALYAKKFQGIRRSGPRVKRMNRAAWLHDRARMFRKPMSVEATGIKTTVVGKTAMVRFTQNWSSKSYKDTGDKQMVLVNEGARWLISQEAMLVSKLKVSDRQTNRQWFFVYKGRPILDADPDMDWGEGAIRFDDEFNAYQKVREGKLPDTLRRWQGEKLTLIAPDGQACSATITGFELAAHATWHFGTIGEWQSGLRSKTEITEAIWAQAKVFLSARVSGEGKNCTQAIIARPASAAVTAVHPFAQANAQIDAEAQKLFRQMALPTVDNDEDKLAGNTAVWASVVKSASYNLPALVKADHVVMLSHDPGGECGEETTGTVSVSHLWAAGKTWNRIATDADGANRIPKLLVDLDNDGAPEMVFSSWPTTILGVQKIHDGGFEVVNTLEVPFFDCGC